MTAKIVDLARWREDHPPAVRCALAMSRCWWKWWTLPWELLLRLTAGKR